MDDPGPAQVDCQPRVLGGEAGAVSGIQGGGETTTTGISFELIPAAPKQQGIVDKAGLALKGTEEALAEGRVPIRYRESAKSMCNCCVRFGMPNEHWDVKQ